jgi:hypothetical protein
MRRVDDELARLKKPRRYFKAPDRGFITALDWGTLIELVNEDHADLVARRVTETKSAASLMLDRLDAASVKVGAPARMAGLEPATRQAVADALEKEARALLDEKHANYPASLDGRTLVIEFARGGPQGSEMPLPLGYGYAFSLARLSPAILERASILYVWVTPEESRRKNQARTDPNDPGSILHHGVPIDVMVNDYGCDDMAWLVETSGKKGTVAVEAHGRTYHLPVGRFDNRVDKTSFLRNDQKDWKPDEVRAIHDGLKGALDELASQR